MLADPFESNRERANIGVAKMCQQRDDQGTIQPPRQQDSDRHISNAAALDRSLHRIGNSLHPLRLRHVPVRRPLADREAPIPLRFLRAVRLDRQPRAGRELLYAVQYGPGRRHGGVEAEEVMHGDRIDRGIDAARHPKSWKRGCETKESRTLRVVQRLYPKAIPRQDDRAAVALPNREGEHSLEFANASWSPGMIGLQNDLGVALREKAVIVSLKLGAQFPKIVDAAIEHHPEAEVIIHHWLLRGGCQIQDAETPMSKRQRALCKEPLGIRTARAHRLCCLREFDKRDVAARSDLATNSTHAFYLSSAADLMNAIHNPLCLREFLCFF